MIRNRLFGRFYLVTVLSVFAFAVLGFFTSRLIIKISQNNAPEEHHRRTLFLAHLVDRIDSKDRIHALQVLDEASSHDSQNMGMNSALPVNQSSLALLDENGQVLYPAGKKLPFDWTALKKPDQEFATQTLNSVFKGGGSIVRFPGQPSRYLLVAGPRQDGPPFGVIFSTFASLITSVLLGIGFSTLVLFLSLREKAGLADSVLAELQRGNLKARFPITKMDEFGHAMSRFNRMADEIERLVEQVRSAEKSRMILLQDLAHDLRTPIASLKNLLETMAVRKEAIQPALREEMLSLALRESDYFERLIEDLLVLAQVSEPKYGAKAETFQLNELLQEEVDRKGIICRFDGSVPFAGDSQLIRRMIRNILENASSFAKSSVHVELASTAGGVELQVLDDGPGFSPEALKHYGERRVTRVIERSERGDRNSNSDETQSRLSVGLGSVIVKTVAELHRGNVRVENSSQGGALVIVRFPGSTS